MSSSGKYKDGKQNERLSQWALDDVPTMEIFNHDNSYITTNAMWRDVYDPGDISENIFTYSMPMAHWHPEKIQDGLPEYLWGFNNTEDYRPVRTSSLLTGGAQDAQARESAAAALQKAEQALQEKMDETPASIQIVPNIAESDSGHIRFHYAADPNATTELAETQLQLDPTDAMVSRIGQTVYNRLEINGAKALALQHGCLMLSDTGEVRIEKTDETLHLRPGTTGGAEVRDRFGSARPVTASQFNSIASGSMLPLNSIQSRNPELYDTLSAIQNDAVNQLLALEPIVLLDETLLSAAESPEAGEERAERRQNIAQALGLTDDSLLSAAAEGVQYALDPTAVALADPVYTCFDTAGRPVGLDYAAMVPTLIAAIKQQNTHIQALETRLELLEEQP